MAKMNPLKIGFGAGFILLGTYLLFNKLELIIDILGIISIAIGLSLIAWN